MLLAVSLVLLQSPLQHLPDRDRREQGDYKETKPKSALDFTNALRKAGRTASITGHGGKSDPSEGFEPVVGTSDLIETVSLGEVSRLTRRSPDGPKVHVREVVGKLSILLARTGKDQLHYPNSPRSRQEATHDPEQRPSSDPDRVVKDGSLDSSSTVLRSEEGSGGHRPTQQPVMTAAVLREGGTIRR